MSTILQQFKQFKKGALLYISLDEDLPIEKMQFILVELLDVYYHDSARGYYAKLIMVNSYDKWRISITDRVVHYGIHKITNVTEAPPDEYILYKLEEEGNGEMCAETNG